MAQQDHSAQPVMLGWQERATGRVLGLSAAISPPVGVAITAGLLAGSWAIAYSLGGSSVVPPHWFYVPILFAGVRFGALGALLTAIAAALLAGPALPADTATGAAQPLSDWAARGGFFVAIGLTLSVLLYDRRPARARRLDTLRADRMLRRALTHDELTVHYQPVFEIRGRRQRLVGAEALVRWQHPRHGLLAPGQFIEIAEDTGRIHELGERVLRLVARQLHEWEHHARQDPLVVGVNVSGVELDDPHLADRVRAALDEAGANPVRLGIEITETALMTSKPTAQAQLVELRDLGVHLAVDDFGTGYSSLAYVHQFPIETIKIDGSFTSRITDDDQAASIVSTIIELTHTLGYVALAEGVETSAQLKVLKAMGCDCAQGFHLARPAPAYQLTTLLANQRARRRHSSRTAANAS
ncbi:MAG TPA: EAL domain-containing protein [Acidimicrobiia bacterium]|jgi:EAL domain-containing protein (putative c-di-GMP-specific phosphodiesterase class I)